MKIAIVAAEISPWAKAGGLADVIGALPAAFKDAGAEVAVIVPGYRPILAALHGSQVGPVMTAHLGADTHQFRVLRAEDTDGVPIYMIDHPGLLGRDGVYGENGTDYPDNLQRFVLFSKAAAMVAAEIVRPDVMHVHDWHCAAAAIVARADTTMRTRFAGTLVVLTIHNMAFQGIYDAAEFPLLGIDPSYMSMGGLEFFGRMNLMKGAVALADGVSTVSPTYAREVTADPEFGFGLEGVLRNKGARFVGILNGADYREWNPARDQMIAATYSASKPGGKRVCTRDLRASLELPAWDDRPLVGMVTRLTTQKGLDLLRDALADVMRLDLQLVMLSSGDKDLEDFFADAVTRYPNRLRLIAQFDNAMAHRVQAGSDAFLMPSRFEPCGLTQMYALKYGSAPIVRATGGLRDTVTEFEPVLGTGNGFVFNDYRPQALVEALGRMTKVFTDAPTWRRLMANCFKSDFSWSVSARHYLEWFSKLRGEIGIGA